MPVSNYFLESNKVVPVALTPSQVVSTFESLNKGLATIKDQKSEILPKTNTDLIASEEEIFNRR